MKSRARCSGGRGGGRCQTAAAAAALTPSCVRLSAQRRPLVRAHGQRRVWQSDSSVNEFTLVLPTNHVAAVELGEAVRRSRLVWTSRSSGVVKATHPVRDIFKHLVEAALQGGAAEGVHP